MRSLGIGRVNGQARFAVTYGHLACALHCHWPPTGFEQLEPFALLDHAQCRTGVSVC